MKEFPAFLIIIKTNFGKIIAYFIDSKYESTRERIFRANGKEFKGIKETNN